MPGRSSSSGQSAATGRDRHRPVHPLVEPAVPLLLRFEVPVFQPFDIPFAAGQELPFHRVVERLLVSRHRQDEVASLGDDGLGDLPLAAHRIDGC